MNISIRKSVQSLASSITYGWQLCKESIVYLAVGKRAHAVRYTENAVQQWRRDGCVIRSVHNQKLGLDIAGRNTNQGAGVMAFEYRAQANQKWRYQTETFRQQDK